MTVYQLELDTGDEVVSAKITETDGKLYGVVSDDSWRTDLSLSGIIKEDFFSFTITDETDSVWGQVEGVKNKQMFNGKMLRGKRSVACKGIFLPDYTGQWSVEPAQGSFDITLYQTGTRIEGHHSFVNDDASRIDASDMKGGDYSIIGTVQKNGDLLLTIQTMYGYSEKKDEMRGRVRGVKKHEDEIEWHLDEAPKVMHYIPSHSILRRYRLITGSFSSLENRYVMFQGEITGLINQHMIAMNEAYPFSQYVDTDIGQFVVYSKEEIPEKTKVTIYGKMIKIGGGSKRPGEQERKYYYEYQIEAHRWTK